MGEIIDFFVTVFKGIINTLNDCVLDIYGISVSLSDLLFALVLFGLVVSVFWKGARSS